MNYSQDAFTKLDPASCAALLADINPALQGGSAFAADTVTILARDLPFYPGWRFLDIADYETTPAHRRFAVHRPGEAVILNWTNEPIYKLNEKAPIRLNRDLVADYVYFFFTYVRGRHGRFQLCETVDDIRWREEPQSAERKAVSELIMPLTLVGEEADGTFILQASMVFKDSLFRARVRVAPQGTVHLFDEQLLVEHMPILDDTFGQ